MELEKFIEAFLPDWKARHEDFAEDYHGIIEGYEPVDRLHGEDDSEFIWEYFPDALQNFADRICKKQRENCIDEIKDYVVAELENWRVIEVRLGDMQLEFKQPKIDEL